MDKNKKHIMKIGKLHLLKLRKIGNGILREFGLISEKKYNRRINKIKAEMLRICPISPEDKNEYIDYVLNNQLDKSKFVDLKQLPFKHNKDNPKPIAFYLPQFYPFPENDKWFGRGFTEWTNTNKAVPQFTGHYQPHLPIDLGYYSLKDTEPFKRQIELAKSYGIYGFCFYYYWFSGDTLMRKPIENFLNDRTLDMPFCLFWANENWTKLWDGGNKEILFEQKLDSGDEKRFMEDILPFFKDSRYIKIDDCPVLIIYRPQIFPKERFAEFANGIRAIARENGFKDLHLIAVKRENIEKELKSFNMDAALEFYPSDIFDKIDIGEVKIMNDKFVGKYYDIDKFIREKKYLYDVDGYRLYKGCFTNWDSTARKCYSNAMIFQTTPEQYKTWLKDIVNWSYKNNGSDHNYIFINAWNEWAEGAHLEPDQKYGYAYLNATEEAIVEGTREATAMKRAAASIEKNIRNARLLQEMEERRKQNDMAEAKARRGARKKFYGKPAAAKPAKRTRRPKEGGDGESK